MIPPILIIKSLCCSRIHKIYFQINIITPLLPVSQAIITLSEFHSKRIVGNASTKKFPLYEDIAKRYTANGEDCDTTITGNI